MKDARHAVEPQLEKEMLFRYQVVSSVLAREAMGEVRAEAVRVVAEAVQAGSDGRPRHVSVRSLYRWLKQYREKGLEGLARKQRKRFSRVLDEPLLAYFRAQKEADPVASIPELIARARSRGLIDEDVAVCRTTVYRALRRSGVSTHRGKTGKRQQARRFAYHHRMEMVLCDGKHFRAGLKRTKRVVMFFLDDATRMVLSAVVGPSESAALYLRGLYRCVFRFGLMKRLFADNGSAFIAGDSHRVTANLGIHLIHGTVGYPQGRGKVERFNLTAWNALIRHFDRNPEISPDCRSLELRLDHYIHQVYNLQPHTALGHETPVSRFGRDPLPLRFPKNHDHLEGAFEIAYQRKVSADHVVRLGGKSYEVPSGYSGQSVIVHRNALTGKVTFLDGVRRVTLQEVDPATNAYRPPTRSSSNKAHDQTDPTVAGHAQTRFEEAFAPLVDDSGNHYDPKENPHE